MKNVEYQNAFTRKSNTKFDDRPTLLDNHCKTTVCVTDRNNLTVLFIAERSIIHKRQETNAIN